MSGLLEEAERQRKELQERVSVLSGDLAQREGELGEAADRLRAAEAQHKRDAAERDALALDAQNLKMRCDGAEQLSDLQVRMCLLCA